MSIQDIARQVLLRFSWGPQTASPELLILNISAPSSNGQINSHLLIDQRKQNELSRSQFYSRSKCLIHSLKPVRCWVSSSVLVKIGLVTVAHQSVTLVSSPIWMPRPQQRRSTTRLFRICQTWAHYQQISTIPMLWRKFLPRILLSSQISLAPISGCPWSWPPKC